MLLIQETQNNIVISITDDGIGFNMAEIQLGNGLENIKNRASAINAKVKIDSKIDKGTSIKLLVNKKELDKNKINAV